MKRLLQIEFQKLWLNKMSRFLIIVSFIVPFSVLILSSIKIDFFGYFTIDLAQTGIFNFPLIWHIIPFFASYFKLFFALIVVSMVSNEYSNRTVKQNLIDGLSKKEFILSKFYFILAYTLLSSLFIGIATLVIGLIHSSHTDLSIIMIDIEFIAAYFFKLLGFFSFCLFLAVLIKRSAFALGALVVTAFVELIIYENLQWNWANEEIATQVMMFAPFTALYNLINQPIQRIIMISSPDKTNLAYDYAVHWHEIVIVIVWTVIFVSASYYLLKKRDL
jgi:ABC-type transport system involved in multi-copper enzyme maturation permease subunit